MSHSAFWLHTAKMALQKSPEPRAQNVSPRTDGWRHVDYVHFLYTVYDLNIENTLFVPVGFFYSKPICPKSKPSFYFLLTPTKQKGVR